jgi:RHS repeat-associated protein
VQGSSGLIGYLYDADGTRVAKGTLTRFSCDFNSGHTSTYNGFQTLDDYVLDPSGGQFTELDMGANNTMVHQHTNVWAGGKLLATYDPNGLHFYFDDPLGTRRMQTDAYGVVEQACNSLPFGNGLTCLPNSSPTEHLFTGKERDAESGNDYFGARYYASSMGRFLSPDWSAGPTAVAYADFIDPQSLNLYSYVRNNPLDRTDPNGHWCLFNLVGTTCGPQAPPPPPPPPKPPAAVTPGTPQYKLAQAQQTAMNNPNFAPSGTPGTPGRTTHCNQATCQIVKDTGTSTNGLVDKNGNPNLANTDAKTLANSPDWKPATPEEAQQAANQGVVALGVQANDPHGHILTAAPELIPGLQDVSQHGPVVANIGGSIGIANANNVFSRSETVTWYVPSSWKP